MMCLRRSSTRLAVSGAYDDFVRPGSGVIDREFGPFENSSFRLDVSEQIDSGSDSWQLGTFAAPAIAADTECELGGERCDTIIWLTGRVDYDLNVGAISHIPEKVASSGEAFEKWRVAGAHVTLFVPSGENFKSAEQSNAMGSFEIVSVDRAQEVCQRLGLGKTTDWVAPLRHPSSSMNKPENIASSRRTARSKMLAVLMILLLAAGGICVAFPELQDVPVRFVGQAAKALTDPLAKEAEQPKKKIKTPDKIASAPIETKGSKIIRPDKRGALEAGLKVRLLERRPPSGHNCAEVHFGGIDAVLTPVETDKKGRYRDSKLSLICGLSIEVAPHGSARYAGLFLKVRSGKMLNNKTALPTVLKGAALLSKKVSWAIDLPIRMRQPFAYELYLVEATQPVTEAVKKFRRHPDTDVVIKSVLEDGIMFRRIVHKVNN